jgi:cell filamentation protein
MSYDINALTADCYDGTTCLINKFNIHDEAKLAQIEADITFAKLSELEQNPINENFDFEHYKSIHKYLFSDLYDWAGQVRTVNIAKKGTSFVSPEDIEELAKNCFSLLKSQNYFKDCDFDSFVSNIVDFYSTTNMLHPFREGNGRTQRVFYFSTNSQCRYDINFENIDSEELMIATIQAANGVTDNLYKIFKKSIVTL